MLKNLLIYRITLFNLLAFLGVAAAYERGWVDMVVQGDQSRIVFLIGAILITCLCAQYWRCWRVSRDINAFKTDPDGSAVWIETLRVGRDKAMMKVAWMGDASGWLVGLGLLGTVVGFIMALAGVAPDSLLSAKGVSGNVSALMAGMRVAMFTTLIGGIASLWVEVNGRMITTALHNYWCDMILRWGKPR